MSIITSTSPTAARRSRSRSRSRCTRRMSSGRNSGGASVVPRLAALTLHPVLAMAAPTARPINPVPPSTNARFVTVQSVTSPVRPNSGRVISGPQRRKSAGGSIPTGGTSTAQCVSTAREVQATFCCPCASRQHLDKRVQSGWWRNSQQDCRATDLLTVEVQGRYARTRGIVLDWLPQAAPWRPSTQQARRTTACLKYPI
jgi:hypothetical protein